MTTIIKKQMNVGNADQVAKRQEDIGTARDREMNDIRTVLSTRSGRRFYWRYLELAGVFRLSFDGSSRTYFNEGERNVGLKLMADLMEAAPEQYLVMMKEAEEDKKL